MSAQSDQIEEIMNPPDYPVRILKAKYDLYIPWIIKNLPPSQKILDLGCGTGMLSNALAKKGHRLTGIDLSEFNITTAKNQDETNSVRYLQANGYSLPFADGEFDSVLIMDVLEHVEEPALLLSEAARVLRSKGLIFFHTMNRTLLSYFLVIHGLDECTPSHIHSYLRFIKPNELEEIFDIHKLDMQPMMGIRPKLSLAFWKMLMIKEVPMDFSFRFSRSLKIGYVGFARKRSKLVVR